MPMFERCIVVLLLLGAPPVWAQVPPRIAPLPPDLESELALSALPPHLRADATLYTLRPDSGFEVVRVGSNGFHALVARQDDALYRGGWTLRAYRDDMLIPIAFDAEGAQTIMPVHFDIARLMAAGMPPPELKRTIQVRYADGSYRPPARAGVSYMLAPVMRAYEDPDAGDRLITVSNPHVMYYAPGLTNAHIGGRPMSQGPFIINSGPHGYMIHLLGEAERTAIVSGSGSMLRRLCQFHPALCLVP